MYSKHDNDNVIAYEIITQKLNLIPCHILKTCMSEPTIFGYPRSSSGSFPFMSTSSRDVGKGAVYQQMKIAFYHH